MKKAYFIYFDPKLGHCPSCHVVEPFVDLLNLNGYDIEKITREAYAEKFNVKKPVTPRIAVEGEPDTFHKVYFREDNVDVYTEFQKEDIGKRIKNIIDKASKK
jgi:hypothetical protein